MSFPATNNPNKYSTAPELESLEQRLMLTTVVGGEVFEFIDASNQYIRVALDGDIVVELIGAFVDGDNSIILGNLPGTILSSNIGRDGIDLLGGAGGLDGVELLGAISITDVNFSDGSIAHDSDGSDLIVLQALASMDLLGNGATYGFNIAEVDIDDETRLIVQLVNLSNATGAGTVQAMLQQASLGEDIMSTLQTAITDTVSAFAVDPTSGVAYAMAGDHLYSVNRFNGAVTDEGAVGGGFTGIQAMSFDSTGALYVIGFDVGGQATLVELNLDGSVASQVGLVDPTSAPITDPYLAMAFHPTTDELYAIAIDNDLHQVALTGVATNLGDVQIGSDDTLVQGLAFVVAPDYVNGGEEVVLVGMDHSVTDDETGAILARLISIGFDEAGIPAAPLCEPGAVETVFGLASYTEAGQDRPLIFASNGDVIFRGSAVSLPVDADGVSVVDAIEGADFRPRSGSAEDNLLYFVARDGDSDKLYTIDVEQSSRSAIQNTVNYIGQINSGSDINVTSLTWRGGVAPELYGYRVNDDVGQILLIDSLTGIGTSLFDVVTVDTDGDTEDIDDITGIEFIDGDTDTLYATRAGSDIIAIDLITAEVTVLGPLPDPDDDESPVRGTDLQGLTWNPVLLSPFTGQPGVLLATDATSDELVYVDHRLRFTGSNVFGIYVSQSSPDSSISIGVVPDPSATQRNMDPFGGSASSIRINDIADGELTLISPPGGTGGVFVGAITRDIDDSTDDEQDLPILGGLLDQEIGVRPANFDDLPGSLSDVSAGVRVVESLLTYVSGMPELSDMLLGWNLDEIAEMSVSRDGSIVVVDSDNVDEIGLEIPGDQVAFVDGWTGWAYAPVNIVAAGTAIPLGNIQGLDYGDVDMDGVEELYAIMSVSNNVPSTSVGGGDLGLDFVNPLALTITLGGVTYAIDQNPGGSYDLYRINRLSGGGLDPADPIDFLGEVYDADLAGTVDQVLALESDPLTGQLLAVGLDPDGDQTLYVIDFTPQQLDLDGGLEVRAFPQYKLDGGGVTDPFVALAYSPGGVLYGVQDVAGAHTLFEIDVTDGSITEAGGAGNGEIIVDGVAAVVAEMDFDASGNLIAIDRGAGAGTGRLILVSTSVPNSSAEVSVPGTIGAGLRGLASDNLGFFHTINPLNPASNDDEIWVSPGFQPTLGTLDPVTGVFTQIAVVGAGTIGQVRSMAFALGEGSVAGQQGLYIIDSTGAFYEVDPTDGSLLTAGDVLLQGEIDPATGNVVPVLDPISGLPVAAVIQSMDFNQSADLFGHDRSNGRLVDIDVSTLGSGVIYVGAYTATETGSLRPTVGDIAYDFINDRYLAVDNATSLEPLADGNEGLALESAALMELVGTESYSAVGQDMDSILIGGTVTGIVDSAGSMEMFYAGWIITGYANGLLTSPGDLDFNYVPENFRIAGDIRNIITVGSLGTDEGTDSEDEKDEPNYLTGFDLFVGGKLGQILTLDTLIGITHVENWADVVGLNSAVAGVISEVEDRPNSSIAGIEGIEFQAHELFESGGSFFNDTFDTPQYLGTIRDATLGEPDFIRVSGLVNGEEGFDDLLDYYAVGLMAGQTVTVSLPYMAGELYVGVLDPDGRVIATNYSNIDQLDALTAPFRFTADRPGAYRFVVGMYGDFLFDGNPTTIWEGDVTYQLLIEGVGNIAAGGLVARRDIYDHVSNVTAGGAHTIAWGDLGAVVADSHYYGDAPFVGINVLDGNARSIVAGEIALADDAAPEPGDGQEINNLIYINVDVGDVGLIQSLTSDMGIQTSIGGDLQTIDSSGNIGCFLELDGRLGVLRAASMTTSPASTITVDADGMGSDGIIDLIDVEGDFGVLGDGGPQITIGGLGGNVRYIRVGGLTYQDERFGGGGGENRVTLDPGQALTGFVDDSGGIINVTPTSTTYDQATGAPVDVPVLSYRYHSIWGSAGAVLIDVVSSGGVMIGASSSGNGSPVEIGLVQANGAGRAVSVQADGTLALDAQAEPNDIDLNVSINGNTPIDVFEVSYDSAAGGSGNFTRISNSTGGEIVSVTAATIGTLYSDSPIGLPKNSTGAAVNPRIVLDPANAFPFSQQHVGVVSGNIAVVRSRQAVGNIIVDGQIGTVIANFEGSVDHTDGLFEGIAAPIYATGDIGAVRIGEGIAPSGSGASISYAGVYSEGNIGQVTGSGTGANIWGNIAAAGDIGTVRLNGGAIISANIESSRDLDTNDLESSREMGDPNSVSGGGFGLISVTGPGGIIGSALYGLNAGDVEVRGGFGILNSTITFSVGDTAVCGNTIADGFGIRDVLFRGGGTQGDIIATGRGELLSTLDYSNEVRFSETYGLAGWDPLFDQYLDGRNDIHAFLGTSALAPLDVAGVMDLVIGQASYDLGIVRAYQITNSNFAYGNSIDGISTLAEMENVEVATGRIGYFKPAGDVTDLSLTIAGRIDRLTINGSLLGASLITANGPNGDIRNVNITGDMEGTISAQGIIRTIVIGGDLTGSIIAEATNGGRYALQTLRLGGSLTNGALDINGSVGTIDAAGSLGAAGDSLHVNGDLRTLKVGTNKLVDGSELALDLDVVGNLGALDVTGLVSGNAFVGGDISRMTVRADAATAGGDLITSPITALGEIGSATISDGNLAADLTAGQDLRTFKLTNGDVNAGVTVASAFGDINRASITNGDLLGAIRAPNGTINSLTVTGSDLGPASSVSAESVAALNIAGSILAGASVDVINSLDRLQVGLDIQAGAAVTAGSASSVQVGRDLAGNVTLGYYDRGSTVSVARDLSGNLTVGADTRLTVGGDISGTASISGDLTSLQAGRMVLASLLVGGSAGSLRIGSVNSSIITAGYNIQSISVTTTFANGLIQVGVGSGNDGTFGTGDLNETGRMGELGQLSIGGAMTNSIIAAGGEIARATLSGGMTNSSVSSGLNIGGQAIAAVLADGTPLANLGELQAALSGADRQLFWGDLGSTVVGGAGMVASHLTAGIDAGADGDFANPATNNVASSLTGGQSAISSVRATLDAASTVLADGGIVSNQAVGAGTVTADVAYTVGTPVLNGDLTPTNLLETLVGTAVSGTPLSYTTAGGHEVTITVSGNGQVDVYDEGGVDTDDNIDSMVFSGTDGRTRVTVATTTPGAVTAGRILSADDATVGYLTFDGDLVGDGTTDPDLWIDGPMNTLSFRDMPDDWDGRVGGDVGNLSLQTQGSGSLYIGGAVKSLSIFDSGSNPLLNELSNAPTTDIVTMTADSAGNVWVFDSVTGNLSQVNVATGAVIGAPLPVTLAGIGTPVVLAGMDFLSAAPDVLYAVGEIHNQSPTEQVGPLAGAAITAGSLAVSPTGETFAIQNVGGEDVLVQIDLTDGSADPIGALSDIFNNTYNNNVLALAFDDAGTLIALVNDRDGDGGAAAPADGVALVKIDTADLNGDGFVRVSSPTSDVLPGVFLDGGAMVNDFKAFAVEPGPAAAFTTSYAIRRNLADTEDELVTIEPDGTVTVVGTVQIAAADTNIIGMGFDENGNLLAYNNDGVTAGMILVDTVDPTNNSEWITADGALDTAIDAFAVARSGANYAVYAYDSDDVVGGMFYVNPGSVSTLGILDTSTGQMLQLRGLTEDAAGTPLSSAVVAMAVDNVGAGNDIHVVTQDGRGLIFGEADGTFLADRGVITDADTGEVLSVVAIEFDDVSGDLIGLDARFARLVTIDPATGTAVARMERGAADGTDLTDIAYEPIAAEFYSFSDSADTFVQFRGTTQTALGGITVNSIGNLAIGGGAGYDGRVVATGNTISSVNITGDFTGGIVTDSDIGRYAQTGGDFGGFVWAGGNVGSFTVNGGDFLAGGLLAAGESVGSAKITGSFAGLLTALSAGTISVGGAGEATADVSLSGLAGTVSFGGAFDGQIIAGSAGKVTVGGLLGPSGYISIGGDASSLKLTGGTGMNSYVGVDGYVRNLAIGGTHSGVVAIRRGIGAGRFGEMNAGILVVGQDTGSMAVSGNVTNSLMSFGTWIGADEIYNTADDVITGGSVKSVKLAGDLQDSAIVAGVLPDISYGPDIPSDMRAYVGNADAADVTDVDSAEAGGVFKSNITSLSIRGEIVHTFMPLGWCSVVAAADGIGRLSVGSGGPMPTQRVYGDPFGAPSVDRYTVMNPSEIWIYFDEQLDTSSLSLSQDIDGDNDVTGPSDILGSVLVTDSSTAEVLNDVVLDYATNELDSGDVEGVLKLFRAGGFDVGQIAIQLSGSLVDPAINDRSGLRSALRDLNQDGTESVGEDQPGTILDGDDDLDEGGDAAVIMAFEDAADNFLDAAPIDLFVDTGTMTLGGDLESAWDIDVFRFEASAYEFLSAQYVGTSIAQMALFYQDDQGTSGIVWDDYFELVARYESMAESTDTLYQAFELPYSGDYYVVLRSSLSGLLYDPAADSAYVLELTLASSDDMLDGAVDGDAGLPADEDIAYISNFAGEHNNLLGFNVPRQLVYLDFDGGTATKYEDVGPVAVDAFSFVDIDASLVGYEDLAVNGGSGVVGIVENMISIFTNTPASHPLGSLNVQRITTLAEWTAATEGIYFTTVDPATWGLDPETDFTTVFFGDTDHPSEALAYGLASDVDLASQSLADNGLVFASSFAGLSTAGTTVSRLNDYARALANTGAHELGHTLGLNHQPTVAGLLGNNLLLDDPDNNIATLDDSNVGLALMGYMPVTEMVSELAELGTAQLSIDFVEFGVGYIDTADLLLRWLS